jgi:hypothetical protein
VEINSYLVTTTITTTTTTTTTNNNNNNSLVNFNSIRMCLCENIKAQKSINKVIIIIIIIITLRNT